MITILLGFGEYKNRVVTGSRRVEKIDYRVETKDRSLRSLRACGPPLLRFAEYRQKQLTADFGDQDEAPVTERPKMFKSVDMPMPVSSLGAAQGPNLTF